MPFPIDISLKEYIKATENIKALQWEIKQLEVEEKRLLLELKNLRKSENNPKDSTYSEMRREIKMVIYHNESGIKMCLNCIRTNKKYPELFGHKYICICNLANEINAEKSFTQEFNCICSLKNMDILR